VVKLVRITLLAPVVFLLAWRAGRAAVPATAGAASLGIVAGGGAPEPRARVSVVPWFLVLFVVFAAINSAGWLDPKLVGGIQRADVWLLCVGMAGVGLQTSFADLGRAGFAPIAAGVAQWLLLALTSYGLAYAFCR
jgi:uncharacterized membrane protein YadS